MQHKQFMHITYINNLF